MLQHLQQHAQHELRSQGAPLRFAALNSSSLLSLLYRSAIIPDALLADVIDYDELYTGQRSEGRYTVVETNLQVADNRLQ
jgi:hypothetical protein